MAEEMKEWGPRYLTGTDVTRLEAAEKVTGKAKYTYDINLPGMLYGMILRSPHPHAEVVKVDLSRAEAHRPENFFAAQQERYFVT